MTSTRPRPRRGELLVRVAGSSVNPVDYKIRDGEFAGVDAADLPMTLGRDVAGTVETGDGDFKRGDRVFGMPGMDRGTFAEYVRMKPAELARPPDGVDFALAAGVPLAALTAWQGLFDHGGLKRGERVLILGAPGGVGHLAVQFAVHAGATVFATGRSRDRAFLEGLGATRCIDTASESLDAIGGPVDLVFDLLGGKPQAAAWAAVEEDGRFVSTLGEPDAKAAGKSGVRTAGYMAKPSTSQLGEIAALLADKTVKLVEQQRFGFADLASALSALENEHSQGKILVTVG